MNVVAVAGHSNVWEWFGDSASRDISGSIPHNLLTTLGHAVGGTAIAVLLGVPLAAWLAHHRRGEVFATSVVNIGRVIPTITILAVAVVVSLRNGYGFAPWPIVIALAAMSLPPVFTTTYTAVRQVPADAVDAARAMGLGSRQVLTAVELPLAVPLILSGIRTALSQSIATEALGALFGSAGLGSYISFGIAEKDNAQIQGGALLVAGTAMSADLLLWLLTRAVTPRGLRARPVRRRRPLLSSRPSANPNLGGTP